MAVAIVGLLVLAMTGRELRLRATDHYLATQTYEDIYHLPPPDWLRPFALGYDEALANLLWMRALVYFGEELVHRGQVRHVFDYAEAIITLDPEFEAAYRWAGTAGMYRPVETSVDDMRTAISFLERGARHFPDDGELAWDLGASLVFELIPRIDDPAEKERIRALGVEHLETAARLGAGPDWLVFTNATELRRLGRVEQAIRHLEEMYSTVRDEQTRERIANELAALRNERYAEAFRRANEELERDRRRDFPYVSTDLYLLLGPRLDRKPYSFEMDAEGEGAQDTLDALGTSDEDTAPHL